MLFNNSQYLGIRFTFFIILSIIVMVMDHRNHQFGTIRGMMSDAVAPLQYTVNWPMALTMRMKDNVHSKHELVTENTHLKMQNLLLKAKVQNILALQKENTSLRALLKSSSQILDHVAVAQLLAVNMDAYIAQAILDKGKDDKVYTGQPVLGANGVMGQVIQVNRWTSRLMLITDTRSAVPVVNDRTGMRAIAVGTGAFRPLSLINVPNTADIAVGDRVSTSGLGLLYPVGYPVGIVTSIRKKPGEQFSDIVVSPTAHLYRDTQVLLYWHTKAAMVDEATTQLKQMQQEDKNMNQQIIERVRDGG